MLQTLVLLYIDIYTGLKIQGLFVTLNSKLKIAYEVVFNEIKQIIILDGTLLIFIQTYTKDYEKALENT